MKTGIFEVEESALRRGNRQLFAGAVVLLVAFQGFGATSPPGRMSQSVRMSSKGIRMAVARPALVRPTTDPHGAEAPVAAEKVGGLDSPAVARLIRDRGWSLDAVGEDGIAVTCSSSGQHLRFAMVQAEASIGILFYFKGVGWDSINAFNRSTRFAKAFLDDDGDAVMQVDIVTAPSVPDAVQFRSCLDIAVRSAARFVGFAGGDPCQVLKAAGLEPLGAAGLDHRPVRPSARLTLDTPCVLALFGRPGWTSKRLRPDLIEVRCGADEDSVKLLLIQYDDGIQLRAGFDGGAWEEINELNSRVGCMKAYWDQDRDTIFEADLMDRTCGVDEAYVRAWFESVFGGLQSFFMDRIVAAVGEDIRGG